MWSLQELASGSVITNLEQIELRAQLEKEPEIVRNIVQTHS